MNRGAFFEAAGKLSDRMENLYLATEATLCDIEDELCRKQEPGLDVHRFISADLEAIAAGIEQVMTTFDVLCEAAGQEPRFELAFQVLEAPSLEQQELRQRLDGMRPAPPPSSG
jgi:hypothetical protein